MEIRKEQPGEPEAREIRADPPRRSKASRRLRWAIVIVGLVFLILILREAIDPFGDQPYIEITHGDHIHYVPKDRDPDVPIGRFPTREPGPTERITPDGRIVDNAGAGEAGSE